jgi:hypothetical protein
LPNNPAEVNVMDLRGFVLVRKRHCAGTPNTKGQQARSACVP